MLKLAGFADEVGPNLDDQIRVFKELGITHFELRGVSGKNVLDFDSAMRTEIRGKLTDNGLGVACIGSPIGKVKINDSWEQHFDRFKIAVDMAEFFGAPLIRIFSYYAPEKDQDIRKHRDEVLRRMAAKAEYVKNRNVVLVHENEKDIYGEKGPECLDIVKSVNSPKLRNAFDFANYVQADDNPLQNWPSLKPYTVHIHIKDCTRDTKKIKPAGEGDGHIAEILVDAYKSGYRGFLSLEPHLKVAGHSHGETGADLFRVATEALREICRKNNIPLAS